MATNEPISITKSPMGWKQDGGIVYLVKFDDDPNDDEINDENTIWLYNATNKTYRPFVNIEAVMAAFGDNYSQAMKKLNILPTESLNSPEWEGDFKSRDQGIQSDGSLPILTTEPSTSSTPTGIYGATRVSPEYETSITNGISLMLVATKDDGYISQNTFDKYVGEASTSDFLPNAASAHLYGGYAMEDIFRDLKVKELVDLGNTQYANVKGFDRIQRASDWYKTKMASTIENDPNMILPPSLIEKFGKELLTLPLFQISSEAFKTLIEPVDWTSPEFKAEAEQIKASWYDATMKIADAQTTQAKAIANENYKILKENVEKKYGIKLSDNANAAWGQLENMFAGYSESGALHSGFMNRAMDKYLKGIRRSDERFREAQVTEEEMEQRNHLLQYGSPEEIKAFIDANPEKASNWGLIPDEETTRYFSMENLKKEFPEMNEEELKMYRNILVNEDSNSFTSGLYQNLYKKQFETLQGKKGYQQFKLFYDKLDKEKKAYKEFTKAKSLAGDIAKGVSVTPDTTTGYIPKEGYKAIVGPINKEQLQQKYSDWYTDPTGKTLYGTKRSDVPKEGYEAIAGPISQKDLQGMYSDWYTGDDGKTLYGTKKLPTDTGISTEWKMPTGYAKIPWRPDLGEEESDWQKRMFKDIHHDPENTFLYGKPEPTPPATNKIKKPTTLPAGISPSDSRYWSINPNNLLNK